MVKIVLHERPERVEWTVPEETPPELIVEWREGGEWHSCTLADLLAQMEKNNGVHL